VDENAVSHEILRAAVEVHKELGPGLLESVYFAFFALSRWGSGFA